MDSQDRGAADAATGTQMLVLLRYMEKLKHLPRTGWLDRDVAQPESVAAHSWRLAVLSCIYADLLGLNSATCMRMALLHDLPEAITGDLVPGDDGSRSSRQRQLQVTQQPDYSGTSRDEWRSKKVAREREALTRMLDGAPDTVARAIRLDWEEYEAQATPEAVLVKQLDTLEAYAQGTDYAATGRLSNVSALRPFQQDADTILQEPLLRSLLRALDDAVARIPSDQSAIRPDERRAQEPPTR